MRCCSSVTGTSYEMYKEDTLKASVILALKVSDKILPLEKDPIKLLIFPHHELDKHLPKLVRSGERVAICDAIDRPKLMKKPKEKVGEELKETNTSNKNTMAKKKKEQAVQEEPTKTVKTAAEEKPAKEMKAEAKAEVKSEQQIEAKQERTRAADDYHQRRESQPRTCLPKHHQSGGLVLHC